ncbi:MAG: hypothetical protein AAGF87_11950 [Bacteroidota bacterium]
MSINERNTAYTLRWLVSCWLILGLGLSIALGQTSYSGTVQLPNGEATARISLTINIGGENGNEVRLNSSGKANLYTSSLSVDGLTDVQKRAFKVKLSFSGLPMGTFGGSLRDNAQYNKFLTFSGTGEYTINVALSAEYQGTTLSVSPASFSLTRNFIHPNGPVVQAVEEEPEPEPEPSSSAVADTDDEDENDRSTEVQTTTPARRDDPAPAQREREKSPAEADYERIGRSGYTAQNYVDEWRDKPDKNRSLLEKALRKVPIVVETRELADGHLLIFDYVRQLEVDSIYPALALAAPIDKGSYKYELTFPSSSVAGYQLQVSDPTKIEAYRVLTYSLDNMLSASMVIDNESQEISIQIKNGQAPYQLLLKRDGRKYGSLITTRPYSPQQAKYDEETHTWTIKQAYLAELANETGDYTLELYDATGSTKQTLETVSLVRPSTPLPKWLPYVAGLLGLLVVYSIMRGRSRKRAMDKARQALKDQEENRKTGIKAIESTKETQAAERVIPQRSTEQNTNTGFKVKKRDREQALDTFEFKPDTVPAEFLSLGLARNWRRSLIDEVLFSRRAIQDLDAFLRAENTNRVITQTDADKWERNEAIPEIGGMLMGQYRQASNGDYRVSVEEFIPLEARTQNVIKVEIDPVSLARDLGNMQDEHPELTVVGWFHTHPGHGLFLSEPDLKVQLTHFRKPFQFAMEIDSLSEHLDTAFFSYRAEGVVNNREQRIDGSSWFSWSEIEKFTRKRPVS